ncbi:ras family-domain-containing protein [Collybia nuda]|uniref:Ras family-domain-containing protein n=1 Tax=Collybia nuda TaxID=64659 RepID=A0A9P6CI56_9AGAR|nr:ras family-domain-containing protein [Collybia nuda]
MLETQMIRQQALHENLFKNYLLQHCLSWYTFARDLGIQVEFGDIMLVTECSKTTVWASAVYSQSSKEFGMSFSAGGTFLPTAGGVAVSAGLERIGPVEYRRSQRRAITLGDVQGLAHDQTVFVKAYRLGSRSLYLRSLAHKIMKSKNRSQQPGELDYDESLGNLSLQTRRPSSSPTTPPGKSGNQPSSDSINRSLSDGATFLFPEWPDFHPSVALLAHSMETSNVEIVAVHDNEWCSNYSAETARIIDEYAERFFGEQFSEEKERCRLNSTSGLSLTPASDRKSATTSEEQSKYELLAGQGIYAQEPRKSIVPLSLRELKELPEIPLIALSPEGPVSHNPPPPSPKKPSLIPQTSSTIPDEWKIALLGDGGVGKTALAVQFTTRSFIGESNTYDPTIEQCYRHGAPVDNQFCCFEIIDTAGQREYATLTDQWIREGQAFALVYSVASRATFERLELFRQSLFRVKRKQPYFVLVANKTDIHYNREVSLQEGKDLAEKFGCEYIEASAKTGYSVQKVFFDLVRILRAGKSPPPNSTPKLHGDSKGCILM